MAFLEDSPEAPSEHELQIGDDIGEEVEVFAKFLDECIIARGSAPEQRARIFKLVDHYYGYARETADVMRERVRLARLARGGSGDSTSSSINAPSNNNKNNNSNNFRSTRSAPRLGLRSGGGLGIDDRGTAVASTTQQHELDQSESTAASAQRWDEEAQTWDLLRRLLPLRYREKNAAGPAASAGPLRRPSADKPPQSRREYWADFVLTEPKARERKTILEWLQSSASSSGPDIDEIVQDLQRNAERGEILAHGWLHTRGAIKQHKRLLATSEALDPDSRDVADSNLDAPHKLVTQLDPDVATRQAGRKLAPQDAFFEQAIWLGCYELLRRGKSMSEIRDWCVERTEVWRAASISALPLSNGEDDDVPDFDCLSTVLWRRMCYRLSQEGSADVYERAVYGILSGDLASVEAVSKSWDDLTFAKYNAELRAQFDAYLVRQSDEAAVHSVILQHGDVPTGSYADPLSAPSARTSGVGAGTTSSFLRDQRENRTRKDAVNTPAKALQAAVIDEKLDAFLFQQGVLLAEYANKEAESKLIPKYDSLVFGAGAALTAAASDPKYVAPTDCHGLRILAHVLIVVSALDKLDGKGKDVAALGPLARRHQTEEHAIASYISFLRLARLEELIPLYASKLLGERCYTNMALNLIHIEDRDIQVRLLQLMRKLGLDPVKFVKTLPQLFLAEVVGEDGKETQQQKRASETPFVFNALHNSPPTLKFGRQIKTGIFGASSDAEDDEEPIEDPDDVMVVDKSDELLIRSMEWMMLVDGLVFEMCDFGVRIYKYFFKHGHLTAARVLAARVSSSEIIRQKTRFGSEIPEEADPAWWDEVFGAPSRLHVDPDAVMMDGDAFNTGNGGSNANGLSLSDEAAKHQIAAHARPLYELECLVNALDCLETTGVLSQAISNSHAA